MPRAPGSDDEWLHEAAQRISRNGGSSSFSYSTVSLFLGLLGSVIFGVWSVTQAQFSSISSNIDLVRKDTGEKANILATQLASSINGLQAMIDRSHSEFAGSKEFSELKDRVLDDIRVLRLQLSVLEQTRPTTGELSAVSVYVKDQTARLEERVRQLEQNQIHTSKGLLSPP